MALSENLQCYHQGRMAIPLGLFKSQPMAGTDSDGYSALGGTGYTGFSLAVDKQWFPNSIGTEFPTSADSALYTPQTDLPIYAYPDAYRIPLTPPGATIPSTARLAKVFQLDFGPDDRLIDRLCWWLDELCVRHNIALTPNLLKHDGNADSVLVATDGETAPYTMTEHRWAHWDLYKRIRQRIVNIGRKLGLADASRSDFWAVGEYAVNNKPQGDKYPLAHQGQSNRFHWMPAWTEAEIDAWDAYGKIDRRNFTRAFPGRLYPLMPQFWTYHATKRQAMNVPLTRYREITTHWVYDTASWQDYWTLFGFVNIMRANPFNLPFLENPPFSVNGVPYYLYPYEFPYSTRIPVTLPPPGTSRFLGFFPGTVAGTANAENWVWGMCASPNGILPFVKGFDPYAYMALWLTPSQYATVMADAVAFGADMAANNRTGFGDGLIGSPPYTFLPGSDGSSTHSTTTGTVEAANIPFPNWQEVFNAYVAAPWQCYPSTADHLKTDVIRGGIATGSQSSAPYRASPLPSGIPSNFPADVENTFMRTVWVVPAEEGEASVGEKKHHGWTYQVQSSFIFSICHVDGATLRQKFGFQTSGAELRSVVTSTLGFLGDGNAAPPSSWNLSNLWGTVSANRYDPTRGTTPRLQPDPNEPNTWYWSQPMRQGGRIETKQDPFNHPITYTYGWIAYTPDASKTTPSGFPDDSISRNGVDSNAICQAIVDAIKAGVDTHVLGTVTPAYGTQITAFDVEGMLDAVPPYGKDMFFLAVHCDPIEFPAVPSNLPGGLADIPASNPLWHNFLLNHDVTKERDVTSYIDTTHNSGQGNWFTRYDGVPVTVTGIVDSNDLATSTGLSYGAYTLAMQNFTHDWERMALQSYIWGVRATTNGYGGTPQSGLYCPFGYWRMTQAGGTPGAFQMATAGSCTLYDPYFNWVTLGHLTGLTDYVYGPFPFWFWCNKELNYRQAQGNH